MILPIRYFGGKGTMNSKIINYFPFIKNYNIYIEPFAGSFSLGFAKGITPIEIYNDKDKNVYSLYYVLSNPELFIKFKEKCDLVYYSEDLRKEFKLKLKDKNLDIVDRAFYFFYVNHTSHNGFGGISFSKNVNNVRRNMSKSISDMLSTIDGLNEIHQRLSRITILNRDGIELIKDYDVSDAFIYCDPPYEWSTRTEVRYSVDMNHQDQENFINTAINIKNAKLLISGYDCDLYQKLLNYGFKSISFDVKVIDGNFNKKIKTETLWMNY